MSESYGRSCSANSFATRATSAPKLSPRSSGNLRRRSRLHRSAGQVCPEPGQGSRRPRRFDKALARNRPAVSFEPCPRAWHQDNGLKGQCRSPMRERWSHARSLRDTASAVGCEDMSMSASAGAFRAVDSRRHPGRRDLSVAGARTQNFVTTCYLPRLRREVTRGGEQMVQHLVLR
jgi:hypothetical protein